MHRHEGETVLRHHEGGVLDEEYDQAGAPRSHRPAAEVHKLDPLKLVFESPPDYSFFTAG